MFDQKADAAIDTEFSAEHHQAGGESQNCRGQFSVVAV